jgi:hypothetical protein
VLAPLADDPAIIRSGISAAADVGADLTVSRDFEGYLPSAKLRPVADRYALIAADGGDANVRLHVTGDDAAAWLYVARVAPAAVVAADLIDRDGSRDQAAGVRLAGRLRATAPGLVLNNSGILLFSSEGGQHVRRERV